MKLLKDDTSLVDEHPLDRHYRQLACDIRPLDAHHPTVQLVKDYVKQTHGRTHTAFGLEVDEVSAGRSRSVDRLWDSQLSALLAPRSAALYDLLLTSARACLSCLCCVDLCCRC